MAQMTANYFGLDASLISKADSSNFKQTAKRPARTGFILGKAVALGYAPLSFQEGIAHVAEQL